jgi:hypothetical protein
MQKWEYCELVIEFKLPQIVSYLYFYNKEQGYTEEEVKYGLAARRLGLEGWEMVTSVTHPRSRGTPSATETSVFFKRPVPEEAR